MTAAHAASATPRDPWIRRNTETIIAVMLGLVSIGTAYVSFQAAMYDGDVTRYNTLGTNQGTEAESLYLEGNQQYVQDAQLFDTLNLLALDAQNADPAIASSAQVKYDTIYFQSVSEEFDAAIQWADEQNATDPELWYSPLDHEDYLTALFGGYEETKALSDESLARASEADANGDKLTLYTVLMALSLFLLGIAAVVQAFRMKAILAGVGVVIFLVAGIAAVTIPFMGI